MSADNKNTKCIHAGEGPAAGSTEAHCMHAHTFPIFQTSTFIFDDAQMGADLFGKKREGHVYGRIGNPTVEKFERAMVELEHGTAGIAFASGMAAVTGAVFPFVSAGDHAVCSQVMYGPSTHFFGNILTRFGVKTDIIDTADTEKVRATVRKGETKVVYVETPGNPLTTVTDLAEVAKIAHEAGAILICDNTFASPIFQNPLDEGADVVLHSITKYVNGHGDVVGGVVIAKDAEKGAAIRKWRTDTGGIMAPHDAFLVLRGIRTLAMRMERHGANALQVAEFLEKHPKVERVTYPGLKSSPYYERANKQMHGGYGATFSFIMKGGFDAAKRVIEHTKLASLAVSLGCLDTLVEHPASMTHASVPRKIMEEQGLCPELIRISVGCEDPKDIIADLEQALSFA